MTEQELSGATLAVTPETRTGRVGEQKRRWDRENMKVCACGRRHSRGYEKCAVCERAARRAQAEERAHELQRLYLAGLSLKQIGEAFGISVFTVGSSLSHLRDAGWDLPYRHGGKFAERRALRQAPPPQRRPA